MKKKIFLRIILGLEIAMFVIFAIGKFIDLSAIIPLNYVFIIGQWCFEKCKELSTTLKLDDFFKLFQKNTFPTLNGLIIVLLINALFIGVYYLIFGTLTVIIRRNKTKRRRKLVQEYEFSKSENEFFQYPHFIKKAPIRRIISLVIPVFFIMLFIFERFDINICNDLNSSLKGFSNLGRDFVEKFFSYIFSPLEGHNICVNILTPYINFFNSFLGNAGWVEYIFIALGIIIILLVWWFFFTLIAIIFRKGNAKRRCKYAKKRYAEKMETREYKVRNKYKDETSAKSDDFMRIVEEDKEDSALSIAKITNDKEFNKPKDNDLKQKAYLDDIGTGVTDLGVKETSYDASVPLTEREIRYIPDEDIDIVLEEEPVIEVVEEDDSLQSNNAKEDEIFFEKYESDDSSITPLSLNNEQPEDVINFVDEKTREQESPVSVVEEQELDKEIENKFEDYKEEIVEETCSSDAIEEEKIITENTTESNNDQEQNSQEEIIEEKTNENVESNSIIEEKVDEDNNIKEEKSIEEEPSKAVSIQEPLKKNDPFAAYRGIKKQGYGAKKVPSFKEINKQKNNG